MVKHIVLLKMKPTTPEAAIRRVAEAVAGLRERIPGIVEVLWGPYSSPEGLNKDFTHGFIMTFESPEARDAYLPHPEHEKVKSLVIEHIDDVIAFDFEV